MAISAFRALRFRNFRLFFSGQSVSLIGTWMTRLATSWLVYRLTGSTLLLGVVGFASQVPTFLLAPVAGVWVDRWNRRRVLVTTQSLFALQTLSMAALTLAGLINLSEVVALSVVQGIIMAFDMPARQSFLVQMVEDRANLGNAIALNSSMVNMARLAGPALAGVVIAAVGEGYCFLIDGLSYLAVILSLLLMRIPAQTLERSATRLLDELRAGWLYVSGFKPVRTLLLMFAIISFMGMPYSVLMPVFASKVLHGGPDTLGLLMGANGFGALASAVRLAVRKSVRGLYKVIASCAAIFAVAITAFAFSQNFWLSAALLMGAGFGMMQAFTSISTVIQTIVPDDKRGRVMSYWTMAYMGSAPFGSLLAGIIAPAAGVQLTLVFCAAGCLAGAAWFWHQREEVREQVRPIYRELGILPPLPSTPDGH